MLNGALAGMVSMGAGSDVYEPWSAVVIGTDQPLKCNFIERKFESYRMSSRSSLPWNQYANEKSSFG